MGGNRGGDPQEDQHQQVFDGGKAQAFRQHQGADRQQKSQSVVHRGGMHPLQGITEAEAGTQESEIVSTLSIAASAMTTTAVIALGVLLLIPLQPVLSSPVLAPAFDNVVPALFGALAFQYFRKGIKIVALPLAVMTVLCVAVPALIGSVGFLIIPSGAMAIGVGYVLWKRESKKEETAV